MKKKVVGLLISAAFLVGLVLLQERLTVYMEGQGQPLCLYAAEESNLSGRQTVDLFRSFPARAGEGESEGLCTFIQSLTDPQLQGLMADLTFDETRSLYSMLPDAERQRLAGLLPEQEISRIPGVAAVVKEGTAVLEGGISVRYLITEEGYEPFAGITLSAGDFLKESDDGSNIAVISDRLSIELFGTADGVGKTLSLEGFAYQIGGIYKRPGWVRQFFEDGMEELFVLNGSDLENSGFYKSGITRVICRTEIEPENFLNSFFRQTGWKRGDWIVKDYQNSALILRESLNFFYFLVKAVAFFLICLVISDIVKRAGKKVKKGLEQQYFSHYLKEESIFILEQLILVTIMIVAAIWLLIELYEFKAFLLPKLLPEGKVFDWNYFTGYVSGVIQKMRQRSAVTPGVYENLYYGLLVLFNGMLIPECALLAVISKKLLKIRHTVLGNSNPDGDRSSFAN